MSKLWRAVVLTASAATVAIAAPAAHATNGPVVAIWHVAPGFYDMSAGMGAMWAINVDEFERGILYRIDPATNEIATVTSVPFSPGGITTGYGSIWLADYYGNTIWRLAPDGHVRATIRVGLQPQTMTAAFGSVWSSNHHSGSLSRIDPASDTVVATVQVGAPHVFRDGPQTVTHDASHVYVGSSNLVKLQAVDPTDDTVSTPAHAAGDDQFCGDLRAAGGWMWSVDPCSGGSLYQLGKDGTVQTVVDGNAAFQSGEAVLDHTLWVSEDQDPSNASQGALVQRDPRTGAVLRTVRIGGDARTVRAGFGDLWVFDGSRGTIRRIAVGS